MAGIRFAGSFSPADFTTLQISSGAITVSQPLHIIQAETGTSDILTTITIDSTVPSGYSQLVIFQAYAGHTITFDDGAANITTPHNADLILSGDSQILALYDPTDSDWKLLNPVPQTGTFAITNWTEDYSLDCNSTSDDELADLIGTIINILINAGLVGGSVSA